jgi:predicted ATPase
MEPVIRKLIIQGFRSFRSEVVEFDNPTFLVGCNGSGKSNLLDALAFLSEAMMQGLPQILSERGGGRVVCSGPSRKSLSGESRTMAIGVVLGAIGGEIAAARYAFEIEVLGHSRSSFFVRKERCWIEYRDKKRSFFDRAGNASFHSNVGGLMPQIIPERLALPLVAGDMRFAPVFRVLAGLRVYSIKPDKLREWQFPDAGRVLRADCSNAASVLREIADNNPDDLQRICEFMEAIVPAIRRIDLKEYGSKLAIEFIQRSESGLGDLTLEATSMSDGTLRALGLLAAVYQRQTPSLIAIEEPEATIHTGALEVILDVLRFASRRTQVIVTTHSPDVLDGDWLEDRHIRIVMWQDGESRVTPVSDGSRAALREHLMSAGELLRSNALQGMPPEPQNTTQSELFEDLVA